MWDSGGLVYWPVPGSAGSDREARTLGDLKKVVPLRNAPLLVIGLSLPALLSLGGCESVPPPPPPPSQEAYQAELESWQARHIQELKEPDSWLSVVNLHWIQPGDIRIGSDPEMDLVLAGEGVLPWVGTLSLRGEGSFEYSLSPEAAAAVGAATLGAARGEEVPNPLLFRVDSPGAPPLMTWGTFTWFVIERFGEYGIRVRDSASEALANFEGLESYPIDLDWRIMARFDRYDPPREIPNPNVLDIPSTATSPGAAVFEVDGEEYRLDLTGDLDSRSLFVVFGDKTNGAESYAGGRFLNVEVPNEDGWVVVDFNRAYNPPCVFTPYATCPVPAPQNKLALRVEAGEKMYHGAGHEPIPGATVR